MKRKLYRNILHKHDLILHHPFLIVTHTTVPAILHRRRILHPPWWRVLPATVQNRTAPRPAPRNSSGLRAVLSLKENKEKTISNHPHNNHDLILHHPFLIVTHTTVPALLHRRRILHPPGGASSLRQYKTVPAILHRRRILHPPGGASSLLQYKTEQPRARPPGIRPDFARFLKRE